MSTSDWVSAPLMFNSWRETCGMALGLKMTAYLTLGLHRVIAITDCENTASVALLERLGLRREGHFLQNVWFKGKWRDEYLYAMLQEEWRNMRK